MPALSAFVSFDETRGLAPYSPLPLEARKVRILNVGLLDLKFSHIKPFKLIVFTHKIRFGPGGGGERVRGHPVRPVYLEGGGKPQTLIPKP